MSRELVILEKLEKEINLKELQIKSLLTITQAINDNVSADGLFNMYKSFLSWEMGIEIMALYVKREGEWYCPVKINLHDDRIEHGIMKVIIEHKRLHTIKADDPLLEGFDIIIPVFHKEHPIAYSLIGGIRQKEDLYNKIQFITTITNIIAVAIENKRLFNRQLEQERFKKEIELAGEVQKMLIPESLPNNQKFELSSIYKPHFNIGGDYFDCIKFQEDHFAFCIADISGKGVAAALLMANFQAIIQSLIFQYRDLETFVFALNQSVYRITKSDKFITFFIADVNLKKNQIKYINAGHYPPFMKMDGKIVRLDKGCTVIGAFEKLPDIKEECIDLKGETVVLSFTDGLTDLKNTSGDYFGDLKIEENLRKHNGESAEEFNKKLLEEIDTFKGDEPYTDDIAVLTCRLHGKT
ncbi:MAG: PP2C family protein-serine/threonine phosphatase [Bacteroidia bacterium]|nr:PP2C family protein-serine/threonine phosphatase [Bacteroidia bacterium]